MVISDNCGKDGIDIARKVDIEGILAGATISLEAFWEGRGLVYRRAAIY